MSFADQIARTELEAALRVAAADLAELARRRALLAALVRSHWRGGSRARFDELLGVIDARSHRVADAIDAARAALARAEALAGPAGTSSAGGVALRGHR